MYFQVNENKKFKFIHAIFHLSLSLIKMLHYFFYLFIKNKIVGTPILKLAMDKRYKVLLKNKKCTKYPKKPQTLQK
jgi:hypothetical protein